MLTHAIGSGMMLVPIDCSKSFAVRRIGANGRIALVHCANMLALLLAGSASAQTSAEAPAQQSARHTDAHADRVVIVPTAETQPKGTVFVSSYEIVLLSAGYALTDRLQSSITGTTDFKNGFAELNLKANLLRSPALRLSLQSSIDYIGGSGLGANGLVFGRVGGTAQICFELPCRTSLSLHAMVVVHDEPDTLLPFGAGAGFTARISRAFSALLEYSMLINAAHDLPIITLPVHLVAYGVRVCSHPSWAFDLAFIRRMHSNEEIRTRAATLFDLLGVPLLAFTYRGKP